MGKAENKADLWVVGVGASAGGLEALSVFLHNLPEAPSNATFLIAQHLAPHAKSMLVELLRKQTKLPIHAAEDRRPLKAGEILIVPPNFDAIVSGGEVRLQRAGEETRPKPSVDVLLGSIAREFGRRSVAIVLSGTGTDGADGVRAVKESGGFVLAQDSHSAKYDGMPKATLDTGLVDAVLPAEQLGKKLYELLQEHAHPQHPDSSYTAEQEVNFRDILAYLRKETGSDFTQYKSSTVQRRIEKRMAVLQIDTLNEYFQVMKKNRAELDSLAQEMLVSVTSFFRDPEAFNALEKQLERLLEKKPANEEFRAWIAGCATGEEAFTVAFLLLRLYRRLGRDPLLKIFASDLDQEALTQARSGLYEAADLADLPQDLVAEFFEPHGRYFEVRKPVRELIVFARQDLVHSPPFVRLDLVTCRNVLIYFEPKLQHRLFEIFHYALKPHGVLLLGKSEMAAPELFDAIDRQSKLFRRLDAPSRSLPIAGGFHTPMYDAFASGRRRPVTAGPSLGELAPLQLLRHYGIVAAVVDETSTIQHIVGNLLGYASLPGGQADFRLTNLLPKSAGLELSALVRRVQKDGAPHRSHVHRSEHDEKKRFTMTVQPLEGVQNSERALFLVSFEAAAAAEKPEPAPSAPPGGDLSDRVIELEQEVAATREHLQTVVEELEISNEELQSLNEELSSTNEELQASNEELETTNEEMQASNEELTTLNEELNVKSGELRVANSNLENILASIDAPVLVVDNELRLLRFNPASLQIFSISSSDYGESVTRLSSSAEIEEFERKVLDTVRTGQVNEGVCRTAKRVFQMRVHPNRDENRRISGAVVVFFDNTELLRVQDHLQKSDARIRAVIDGSPSFIGLKDAMGRYLVVNRAFLELHRLAEKDVLDRTDRDLFDEEVANRVRDEDLVVLLRREPTVREETFRIRGEERIFHVSRFPLFSPGDKNPYAVGNVSHDITAQVQAQRALEENQARYKAIVEDQVVFVCRHLPGGELTFTNESFAAYFGGAEAARPRSFVSLVEPADRARVESLLAKLTPAQPIAQYEHRARPHAAASLRWVRWIHRALFDENGVAREYQAVGFDVTEIHNQTADLLKKENLFTQVLEHTSDIVTVYRVEGGAFLLESFNQSAAESGSFSRARLLGRRLEELVDPTFAGDVLERYRECARTGRVISFEEQSEAPGGPRFLSTTLVPIRDQDNRTERVTALSRDITRLKRAEGALREEKRNAESANRAKSDFLAAISHELRTPLNVITGICYLLAREELKPAHQRLVDSIQRSSKVLLTLINDVLDLSKIEAGKVQIEHRPFAPAGLAKEMVQAFEPQAAAKGIAFRVERNFPEGTQLVGDSTRLRQVMINLVGNALKFTEKGSVTLRASLRADADSPGLPLFRIEVVDTGVGIPEESFPKIFHRFSQADSGTTRKFGGTGLGLAISKQLVELMGGQIGFTSRAGEGSTFWFELRLEEAVSAPGTHAPAAPVEDAPAGDLKRCRVLAVDDVAEALNVLRMALEPECGHLTTVGSGQAAIDALGREPYDVVLLDVQMPEMDGFETTRRIRALPGPAARTPIVALTANAMAGDEARCRDAGMDDYLTKPVDFDRLRHKILRWAEARSTADTPAGEES